MKRRWSVIKGQPLTEMDRKILAAQKAGKKVPSRDLVRTPEEIEGIRKSGVLNTSILDMITNEIKEGMTTGQLNDLVHQMTLDNGGIQPPSTTKVSLKVAVYQLTTWCVTAYPTIKHSSVQVRLSTWT